MNEEISKAEQYQDPNTGYFKEGNPGGGRPKDTPEQKIIKKAVKELVQEYKENLAQALPLIEPVVIKKAIEGDMTAVKEIHDRVMGRSEQKTDITTGGKPLYLPPELIDKNDLTSRGPEPDSQ